MALGKTGYNTLEQTMKSDLKVWAIEASDMISRPRTFVVDNCQLEVCDNKIQFPEEAQMIYCLSYHGTPMTYIGTRGCSRLYPGSPCCRCSCEYGFTLDSCYAHFKPCLPDGTIVDAGWLCRPYDEEGEPMVLENLTIRMAISEYVASMICLRMEDKRYQLFNDKWLHHVRLARSEVNRILEANVAALSAVYFRKPGQGWGRESFNQGVGQIAPAQYISG